ncbi:hypothetical protein U1Q18_019313 [Sarracenia purpurea var. burkii]
MEGIVVSSGHGNLAIEDQSPKIKPSYATTVVSGIVGGNKQDGLCSHKLGNLGHEILVKGDAFNLKDKLVGDGNGGTCGVKHDLTKETFLRRNPFSTKEAANSSGSGELPMHMDEQSSVGLDDVSLDKSKCNLLKANDNSNSNGLSKIDLHQYEAAFSVLVRHAVGWHLVLGFVLLFCCLRRAGAVLRASAAAKGILMVVAAVRRCCPAFACVAAASFVLMSCSAFAASFGFCYLVDASYCSALCRDVFLSFAI